MKFQITIKTTAYTFASLTKLLVLRCELEEISRKNQNIYKSKLFSH